MSAAYDIVERHWPYDGPHSGDTVTSAAQAVAGLVRYMNNATRNPRRLSGPALYRVLSSLNSVVWGLDQLLDQLTHTAAVLGDDPTLYDDRRDRPGAHTAAELAAALTDARQALAAEPRHRVERAAELACHLGHDQPGR